MLARELGVAEPELVPRLEAAVAAGSLAKRSGWYATPGYVPRLTPEQRTLIDELVPAEPGNLVPAPYAAVALAIRRSHVPGIQAAFDARLGHGGLVRVVEHLYRGEQIAAIRDRLTAALATERTLTAARVRDLVGSTRKYVVPLLEYFDAAGVTVRQGDVRVAAQ
ncbi:MAG: SelB C-terminal domain-containing protein [Candidatus Eremiobacteraeota bacterium]|nr:SelB C-terminal domain-containing protein [Candidatus Eremiobacteraeota bacterium]